MGSTKEIADFIFSTGYGDIPPRAIDIAKGAILDCLGAALAGSEDAAGKVIREYVRELGGKPEAGVIAGGFRTSACLAALSNGTLAHALDYDDYVTGGVGWFGHPTVALLPALLALGEQNRLTGKEVLEAYIIGFEVGGKVGNGLQTGMGHFRTGWHATGTVGTIGAAAAAAKALKLNTQQVRAALGCAASMASGLRQNFGTMMKPYHAGAAGRNGITAAILSKKGFTADENILEGPIGFGKIFSPECDLSRMTAGLGSPFEIISPGLSLKRYPCCAANHRHLDAILYLVHTHHIDATDVAEVSCRTGRPITPRELIHHRPKTALEAKFSLEYNMAVALLDKRVGLGQFTEERVARPDVQALLLKVRAPYPEDVPRETLELNRVAIKLRDGREFSHEVDLPKGHPSDPLTPDEIAGKFRECAQHTLSFQNVERCVDLVTNLEFLEDVRTLMDILTPAHGA